MSERPSAFTTICRRAVTSPDYTFYPCFVGTDDSCHYSYRKIGGHSEMQGTILTACTCHINYASMFSLVGQDGIPVCVLICAYCFKINLPITKILYSCFREIMVSLHGQVAEHHRAYIFFAEVFHCLWLHPLVRTLPEIPENRVKSFNGIFLRPSLETKRPQGQTRSQSRGGY